MEKKEKEILLLKGQIGSNVRSMIYIQEQNLYQVTFTDGSMSSYRPYEVEYLTREEDLPCPVRVTRRKDNYVFHKVIGVSTFIDKDNRIRAYRVVFENGHYRDYLSEVLKVEEDIAKNVYNYLKELAKFSSINVDEDKSISLFQKYEKVTMITKESPLADYINPSSNGVSSVVLGDTIEKDRIIFPFGCNRSQYTAVKNALTKKISVIQGPPGTGKTQTILNIVANLIIAGKSIEIVSNNNSAVLNVKEKMEKEKYKLSWLVAQLGNSNNKKSFYESQSGLYPNLQEWKCDNLKEIQAELVQIRANLAAGYEKQEKLAELRENLRTITIQKKHLLGIYGDDICPIKNVKRSLDAIALIKAIRRDIEHKGKVRLITRLKCRLKGIKDPITSIKSLEVTFYCRSIMEINAKISEIERFIVGTAEMETRLEMLSLRYLQGRLYEMYSPNGNKRCKFEQNDVEYKNPQAFLKEYPVVLSTTFSATTNIKQGVPFDYLIMDEASQVDVSAGALAMNAARNVVIVGDEKQLPNVVTENVRNKAENLFKKRKIPEAYDFTKHSFLSSLCSLFSELPKTMLREHYRCAPTIIGFCNKQFYGGQLIAMTKEGDSPSMKICRTTEGNHAREKHNIRQAEMIAQEILPELIKDYNDIGIISPYKDQVEKITSEIRKKDFENITVDTVHKFQGRENDVIILSTVDNQIRPFVDDPHLLNVAVSRAKKLFILVISANEQPNSNVNDLIKYILYYNGEVFNSKIVSVFDQLYLPITENWRRQGISKYPSENLIYDLIKEILKEEIFKRFDVLHEYPLNIIVPQNLFLEGREAEYASHPKTHLDFLIYDTVTLQPLMAIEVDGTSYHSEGSKQKERDKLKNEILKKIGLPLLRLVTDGSGEKQKIIEMLTAAVQGGAKID